VVGKGHIAPYVRAAERLGVADRVKFWGPVTETAPFYQAATVLALPTLYDPCSNVVLEALACGLPAVTTAANGAAEFITPGGTAPSPADDTGLPGPAPSSPGGPQVRRAALGGGRTQLGKHGGPKPWRFGGVRVVVRYSTGTELFWPLAVRGKFLEPLGLRKL
jgi:hypothetical protein